MSVKSSASSTKRSRKADRAGGGANGRNARTRQSAPGIAKKATAIATSYQVILQHDAGHWYGRGLELPHVFGDGATPDKCIQNTREALSAAVAYLLDRGRKPPTSARSGRRTQQVNVRLTAEEKAVLETIARRKGFQGLSDYLRAAALDSAT